MFWLCACEKQKIWFCFISLWAFLCHLFPFGSCFYSLPQLQRLGKMRIIHWSKKVKRPVAPPTEIHPFMILFLILLKAKNKKWLLGFENYRLQNKIIPQAWAENGCLDWKQCVIVVSFLATAFTPYLVICLFFAQSFTAGFYLTHLTVEAQQDRLSHTSLQDWREAFP